MKKYTYKDFLLGNIIIHVDDPGKAFLILKKCYPESHPVAHEIWAYLIPHDLVGYYGQNSINIQGQDSLEIINASQISLEEHADNRKIIGYICPMDLYGGFLAKGAIVQRHFNSYTYANTADHKNMADMLIPAEIAETWEPVYENKQEEKDLIYNKMDMLSFCSYIQTIILNDPTLINVPPERILTAWKAKFPG